MMCPSRRPDFRKIKSCKTKGSLQITRPKMKQLRSSMNKMTWWIRRLKIKSQRRKTPNSTKKKRRIPFARKLLNNLHMSPIKIIEISGLQSGRISKKRTNRYQRAFWQFRRNRWGEPITSKNVEWVSMESSRRLRCSGLSACRSYKHKRVSNYRLNKGAF